MEASKIQSSLIALILAVAPLSTIVAEPQTCNVENRPILLDVELVAGRYGIHCRPTAYNPNEEPVTFEYAWRFKGTDLDEKQFDGNSDIGFRSLVFVAPFDARCSVTAIDQDGNTQTRWSNTLSTDNLFKRIFSTRSEVQGNFGSVQAGDDICQFEAQQYGLPGQYKAWLSDDDTMPYNSFTGWDVGYFDVAGNLFVREWGWLTGDTSPSGYPDIEDPREMDRSFLYPDFDPLSGEERPEYVWTGTFYDGTNSYSYIDEQTGEVIVVQLTNCTAWTGVGTGQIGDDHESFTFAGPKSCDLLASLLCFEQ